MSTQNRMGTPMKPYVAPLPFEPKKRTRRVDGRINPSKRTAPNVPALLCPPLTPAAKASTSRASAEADGYANFGKRTWFLVSRGESYRAVESLDDAPGWSLVAEMRRS